MRLKRLLLLGLLINILYVLVGAWRYPLRSVDVYSIWLFKAKAFYLESGLPVKTLSNPHYSYSHPYYPLLLPFTFYLFYSLLGFVTDSRILFIYPFIYALICILVYFSLRLLNLSRTKSLLFTYIYSHLSVLLAQSGRQHAGNADIFITLLLWILLTHHLRTRKFWLFPVVIAVASQIKIEGIILIILLAFIPLLKLKKLIFTGLSSILFILWQVLRIKLQFPVDQPYIIYPLSEIIVRSLQIVKYTIIELLNFRNWYLFWPLFFLLLIFVNRRYPKSYPRFWHRSLWIIIPVFGANYLFSYYTPQVYMTSSLDRVLFQLTPLFYPLFCIKLDQLINYQRLN